MKNINTTWAVARVCLFLCSMLVATGSVASTLDVDCDGGATIRDALAKARPGVSLAITGKCKEAVVIPPELSGLTLDGGGRGAIEAPSTAAPGIIVIGREVTIKGLDISGGRNGISVQRGASALIEHNVIHHTGAGGQPGSGLGINVAQKSYAAIVSNEIHHNRAIGILVHENSSARIGFIDVAAIDSGNKVEHNGQEGILVSRGAIARITRNTLRENGSDGIRIERASEAEVADNLIEGNHGNGILVTERSSVFLKSDVLPKSNLIEHHPMPRTQ